VAQLNEQMKLYPEGYEETKMSDEQRGQYVEQKEVIKKKQEIIAFFWKFCLASINLSNDDGQTTRIGKFCSSTTT
jgi:hypothetical protein